MREIKCKYCEHENNDFVILNETKEYSGLEVAMNRQGMLRIRHYSSNQMWAIQDIVNIKYCPMCGKKINT